MNRLYKLDIMVISVWSKTNEPNNLSGKCLQSIHRVFFSALKYPKVQQTLGATAIFYIYIVCAHQPRGVIWPFCLLLARFILVMLANNVSFRTYCLQKISSQLLWATHIHFFQIISTMPLLHKHYVSPKTNSYRNLPHRHVVIIRSRGYYQLWSIP